MTASASEAMSTMLKAAFESLISGLHTCTIGEVVTYNLEQNSVDIQPVIVRSFEGAGGRNWYPPVLKNVPVLFPSTQNSAIIFPLQAGDSVLLVMSDACLDVWKSRSTAGSALNTDGRKFDFNDAIAIPGVFSFPRSVVSQSKHQLARSISDLTITHNLGKTGREAQVKFTHDGTIEINAGIDSTIILDQNGEVTINAVTKMTLNAATLLEVNAPLTNWTGDIVQIGNMDRTGNSINTGLIGAAGMGVGVTPVTGEAKITGNVTLTGDIDVTGDSDFTGGVTANGKTIDDTHTHSGVQAGAGNTGAVN